MYNTMNKVQFDIAMAELDPVYKQVVDAVNSKFYFYLDALKRNLGSGSYYGYISMKDIQNQLNNQLTRYQINYRLTQLVEQGILHHDMRYGHIVRRTSNYRPAYIKGGLVKEDPDKPKNLIIL